MKKRNAHPVFMFKNGTEVSRDTDVVDAIRAIWGYSPSLSEVVPASSGVWLVPVPERIFNQNAYEFVKGAFRIRVSG